jgi:diguanylate cyclase (GGDEF)-like protein/PAS domain S-box-containing protein
MANVVGETRAMRVLLVVRSPEEARRLDQLLTDGPQSRFGVQWSSGYRTALDLLRRESYDVVVVGDDLSDALGSPLVSVSLLQRVAPATPLVWLMERDEPVVAEQLLRCGVQDCLVRRDLQGSGLARALAYAIERKRAEDAVRASEERFALSVKGSNDGIWDWDFKTGRLECSDRFKAIVAYEPGADFSAVTSWLRRIHVEDRSSFRNQLETHLRGETDHLEHEHRLQDKEGRYRWVLVRGVASRDEDGRAYRMAGSLTDIGRRKAIEAQLQHDALHDSLTGLANRALLVDRLELALAQAKRGGFSFAILFLDLDRFKNINDSLGHSLGDKLLQALAHRLDALLRPADRIARIGGDEFAILADNLLDPSDAIRIALRVLAEVALPFEIGDHQVFTTASVGITMHQPTYERPNDMLRDADIAMYRAKAKGGNRYQVFDPEMHTRAVELLELETDLRVAFDRGELRLHYQPVVDCTTGTIEGFEALVRWQHPRRGLLLPEHFVPLAEETGLIYRIGRWVLAEGCRQAALWQHRFPRERPLSVSVNLSGKELIQADLLELVEKCLDESGLRRGTLLLEITESVVVDHSDMALRRLQELRDRSVKLQLDDFGTGYCSLSYLQRIPTDTLKIDRSFVRDMGSPGSTPAIIAAIVRLAQVLGIGVLAEGVETFEQLEALKRLDCRYAQGFLFSEPVAAEDAERLLASGHRYETSQSAQVMAGHSLPPQ